jgi:hypothetical protein
MKLSHLEGEEEHQAQEWEVGGCGGREQSEGAEKEEDHGGRQEESGLLSGGEQRLSGRL